MKLAEYLDGNRIKRGDFARSIGVSAGWITSLCDGTGWPSREVAEEITRATNGDVTANDFLQPTEPNLEPAEART
jgi:DNA-binding transcriptional regulator YdaS (Cro superfamily)